MNTNNRNVNNLNSTYKYAKSVIQDLLLELMKVQIVESS
jgi:hypothetical protein